MPVDVIIHCAHKIPSNSFARSPSAWVNAKGAGKNTNALPMPITGITRRGLSGGGRKRILTIGGRIEAIIRNTPLKIALSSVSVIGAGYGMASRILQRWTRAVCNCSLVLPPTGFSMEGKPWTCEQCGAAKHCKP